MEVRHLPSNVAMVPFRSYASLPPGTSHRTCPHPNIVQLLGACMRKGDFRIVTEVFPLALSSLVLFAQRVRGLWCRNWTATSKA